MRAGELCELESYVSVMSYVSVVSSSAGAHIAHTAHDAHIAHIAQIAHIAPIAQIAQIAQIALKLDVRRSGALACSESVAEPAPRRHCVMLEYQEPIFRLRLGQDPALRLQGHQRLDIVAHDPWER